MNTTAMSRKIHCRLLEIDREESRPGAARLDGSLSCLRFLSAFKFAIRDPGGCRASFPMHYAPEGYQKQVATAPRFRVEAASFPRQLISNVAGSELLFITINTFLPSGVLKATFGRVVGPVDSMRTEPGRTNLAACARI